MNIHGFINLNSNCHYNKQIKQKMSSISHNRSTNIQGSYANNTNKAKGKQKEANIHSIMNGITNMGMRINPKKISQLLKKQDNNKSNCNQTKIRPQTPDPASNRCYQSIKYPQPQIILKQIQKNVNVLKEMYYASLTQHNNSHSMKNSREDTLAQSHHLTQNSVTHHENGQSKDARRSFDMIGFNKKSVPEINLIPTYQPNIPFNTRSFNSNLFEQICVGGQKNETNLKKEDKDKLKKNKQRMKQKSHNQESKSRERSEKIKIENRKSSKNLHKYANSKRNLIHEEILKQGRKSGCNSEYTSPIHQETKAKTNHENGKSNNNSNINGLFEIFKFYKKSIDSTLSIKNSQANSQNSQKTTSIHNMNTYISTKNQTHSQINPDKSYGKDTPNNSNTKVATGCKNSTNTRVCSIQPSIEVSFQDDALRNSAKGKRSRNSSAQNSEKKSKNKQKRKNQSNQQRQKSKKNVHFKQEFKQLSKNYYKQIQKKKPKHPTNKSNINKNSKKTGNQQESERQNSRKAKLVSQKCVKMNKKQELESQIADELWKKKSVSTGLKNWSKNQQFQNSQNPENRLKTRKVRDDVYQNIEHIEFPQIQSSMFDRNMPILEQDSRQQASSQLIALTNYKDNSPHNHNKNNTQFTKSGVLNLQNALNSNDFKQNNLLNTKQQNKAEDQKITEQNTRYPTPSFVVSEADQDIKKSSKQYQVKYIKNQTENCIQNQISKKLSCFTFKQKLKNNSEQDSLLDCQIPKRESDGDSDLQNFQLVSFEL